jgi:hypothetical protein
LRALCVRIRLALGRGFSFSCSFLLGASPLLAFLVRVPF